MGRATSSGSPLSPPASLKPCSGARSWKHPTCPTYGERFAAGMGAAGGAAGAAADPWAGLRTGAEQYQSTVAEVGTNYQALQQIGVTAFQGIASAMADGKLEGRELLGVLLQVVQQILAMPTGAGGGGAGGILGTLFSAFAGGGGGDAWAGLRIPSYANGTPSHRGGPARVHDGRGGEIIDLPKGSRVYPHDVSMAMAREQAPSNNSFTFAPSYNVQGGNSEDITKLRAQMDRDREQFQSKVLNTVREGQRRGAISRVGR